MAEGKGGNTHQRRLAKRGEERIAKEVTDRVLEEIEVKQVEPMPEKVSSKLATFWGSTPIWGGIGLLIGAIASQLSLKLLFVAVWGIFVFEFLRVGFFKQRATKVMGNLLAGIIFAGVFIGLWRLSPKPKEPTTVDQEMNAFAKRFPWMASPPIPAPNSQAAKTTAMTITEGTVWIAPDFFHGIYFIRFNATKNITPINVMADYTITNTKGVPIMLRSLFLEMSGNHNIWWPLTSLPTRQPIWAGDRSKQQPGVSVITLSEGFLLDKISNRELMPGQSVRGWLLCQIPSDYVPLKGSEMPRLRLRARDTAGDEVLQGIESPTQNDNALYTKMSFVSDLNENLQDYAVVAYGVQ